MSRDVSVNAGGGGCGCVGLVIGILVFWAMFFGLPVGDKKWNIDIFPPRIWDMNESIKSNVPPPAVQQPVELEKTN